MDQHIHRPGPNVDISKSDKYDMRENLYRCNQCKFASFYAGNLKMHLMRHVGERPNKCDQCVYATAEKMKVERTFKNTQKREV